MRIIAGTYRGRVLKSPPGGKTRPTSDRLRETLFNILAPSIGDDTRFLDLCAGTGAIGMEALSRGAEFCTFVDKSRRACALIEENLDALGVPEEQTEIFSIPAENFVNRKYERGWDIVFFDPPYQNNYELILHGFGSPESDLLRPNGILIAEHHNKKHMPEKALELRRWRVLRQGGTCLSFYEKS